MKVVTIHEAEANLPRLIEDAMNGDDVVITCGNQPLVRLVVVEPVRRQGSLGWARGQVTIAPDFDAPLEDFAGQR